MKKNISKLGVGVFVLAAGVLSYSVAYAQSSNSTNQTTISRIECVLKTETVDKSLNIFSNPTGFRDPGLSSVVFLRTQFPQAWFSDKTKMSNVDEVTFLTEYPEYKNNEKITAKRFYNAVIKAGGNRVTLKLFDHSTFKRYEEISVNNIDSYVYVDIGISSDPSAKIQARFSCYPTNK